MIISSCKSIINDLSSSSGRSQGVVVDNNDPERKARVKVSIPGFNDQIPQSDLPWYPVEQPAVNYQLRVPTIGTRVIVEVYDSYNALVTGAIASRA